MNALESLRKGGFIPTISYREHISMFFNFLLKEMEKGGTATAINACFTLQITLKQQLADVLIKATLSQERILSRKD